MLEIVVNGEARSVPDGTSIEELLGQLGIPADRVAVELNRAIIKAPLWKGTLLEAGAKVEIVHFVGGG